MKKLVLLAFLTACYSHSQPPRDGGEDTEKKAANDSCTPAGGECVSQGTAPPDGLAPVEGAVCPDEGTCWRKLAGAPAEPKAE